MDTKQGSPKDSSKHKVLTISEAHNEQKCLDSLIQYCVSNNNDVVAACIRDLKGNQLLDTEGYDNFAQTCATNPDTSKRNNIDVCVDVESILKQQINASNDNDSDELIVAVDDFEPMQETNKINYDLIDLIDVHLTGKLRKIIPSVTRNKYNEKSLGTYGTWMVVYLREIVDAYKAKIFALVVLVLDSNNAKHTNLISESKNDGNRLLRKMRLSTNRSNLSAIGRQMLKMNSGSNMAATQSGSEYLNDQVKELNKMKDLIRTHEEKEGSELSASDFIQGITVYRAQKAVHKHSSYTNTINNRMNSTDSRNTFKSNALSSLVNEIKMIDDLNDNHKNSSGTGDGKNIPVSLAGGVIAPTSSNNASSYSSTRSTVDSVTIANARNALSQLLTDSNVCGQLNDGNGPNKPYALPRGQHGYFKEEVGIYFDYKNYLEIEGMEKSEANNIARRWCEDAGIFDRNYKSNNNNSNNNKRKFNSTDLDANKDMKRQMTSLNKTVKSFIAQVSKNKKKKKKKKKSKEKVFPNQPFSFSSSESDEEDDN